MFTTIDDFPKLPSRVHPQIVKNRGIVSGVEWIIAIYGSHSNYPNLHLLFEDDFQSASSDLSVVDPLLLEAKTNTDPHAPAGIFFYARNTFMNNQIAKWQATEEFDSMVVTPLNDEARDITGTYPYLIPLH